MEFIRTATLPTGGKVHLYSDASVEGPGGEWKVFRHEEEDPTGAAGSFYTVLGAPDGTVCLLRQWPSNTAEDTGVRALVKVNTGWLYEEAELPLLVMAVGDLLEFLPSEND
jgi:hypothetical protein